MRVAHNSKLKIQNSKIPNARSAQFKIQNSKFKIQNCFRCFRAFNGYCLSNIDILVGRHLQRQLNSLVLGHAHSAMRQLLNELRLRPDPWRGHEVECAVGHLLRHAVHTPHALHKVGRRLVGREKEVLALVVVGLSAELHVVAVVYLHVVCLSLVGLCVVRLCVGLIVIILNHNTN